jgi:hypothetical protein
VAAVPTIALSYTKIMALLLLWKLLRKNPDQRVVRKLDVMRSWSASLTGL